MSFPKGFIWGVAAASYQIEGATHEDGKGLSVWDIFCQQPGKIWEGNTGDVASDHYHRYQEDARLMGEIGLKAYRLSISWPRVLPEGVGKINQKGLEFYDRLIDALLENGVQPWITIFHGDYPQALQLRGGWLNPESSDWFAEYTGVIIDKLSDRVSRWMTFNEPQGATSSGYQIGRSAPGLRLGLPDVLLAGHNTLLAHGKAVQVIRARAKVKPNVGLAPNGFIKIPATNSPEDIEAARARMFSVREKDCYNITWLIDPIFLGKYPEDGIKLFKSEMPFAPDRDMETICQPLDFCGVNIYDGQTVRATSVGGSTLVRDPDGPPLTTMGWRVTPKAAYWGPRFYFERYQLPVVITENGMANCDWIHRDGKIHDPQRIDLIARYLNEAKRAIDDGVVVKGYFLWTILDNFEWTFGFKQRFGLIYVDFATGKRTFKDSAYWYKEVIASNGDIL